VTSAVSATRGYAAEGEPSQHMIESAWLEHTWQAVGKPQITLRPTTIGRVSDADLWLPPFSEAGRAATRRNLMRAK